MPSAALTPESHRVHTTECLCFKNPKQERLKKENITCFIHYILLKLSQNFLVLFFIACMKSLQHLLAHIVMSGLRSSSVESRERSELCLSKLSLTADVPVVVVPHWGSASCEDLNRI